MSPRTSLHLILTVLLVTGHVSSEETTYVTGTIASNDTSSSVSSASSTSTRSDYEAQNVTPKAPEPEKLCAWWCDEMYGIIILAASGTSLLIAIIMCIITCCLCRRRKYAGDPVVKDTELDMLCQQTAPDSNVPSPGDGITEKPPASVGISDVENCTSTSEHLTNETPQDAPDQPNDESSTFYPPPPENLPQNDSIIHD